MNIDLILGIIDNLLSSVASAVRAGKKIVFIIDFDGTSSLYEEWYSPDNRIYPFLRDFLNWFARTFQGIVEIWIVSNKPMEQLTRLSGLTGVRFVATESLLYAADNPYLVAGQQVTKLVQYDARTLADEVMEWQDRVIANGTQVGERLFYDGSWELKLVDRRLIGCVFHGKQKVEAMAMRHLYRLGLAAQTPLLSVSQGPDIVACAPSFASKRHSIEKMQEVGSLDTGNVYIVCEDSASTQEMLLLELLARGATNVYGPRVINGPVTQIPQNLPTGLENRIAPVETAQGLLEVLEKFPPVIMQARP